MVNSAWRGGETGAALEGSQPAPAHRSSALVLAALVAQPEVQAVVEAAALLGDGVEQEVGVALAQPAFSAVSVFHGRHLLDAPAFHACRLAGAGEELRRRHGCTAGEICRSRRDRLRVGRLPGCHCHQAARMGAPFPPRAVATARLRRRRRAARARGTPICRVFPVLPAAAAGRSPPAPSRFAAGNGLRWCSRRHGALLGRALRPGRGRPWHAAAGGCFSRSGCSVLQRPQRDAAESSAASHHRERDSAGAELGGALLAGARRPPPAWPL